MIIGMCYVEVYCVKCGYKEGYNSCKPLSKPSKCTACGGAMVHNDFEEEILKTLSEGIAKRGKLLD